METGRRKRWMSLERIQFERWRRTKDHEGWAIKDRNMGGGERIVTSSVILIASTISSPALN